MGVARERDRAGGGRGGGGGGNRARQGGNEQVSEREKGGGGWGGENKMDSGMSVYLCLCVWEGNLIKSYSIYKFKYQHQNVILLKLFALFK